MCIGQSAHLDHLNGEIITEHPETGLIFREVQDLHNNVVLISVLYPAILYGTSRSTASFSENLPGFRTFLIFICWLYGSFSEYSFLSCSTAPNI